MNPYYFLLLIPVIVILYLNFKRLREKQWKKPKQEFPKTWKVILKKYVNFYNGLSDSEQKRFEYKVHEFLLNCRITGIKTEIDDTDKLLVAASAIIPIFGFNNWRYQNIKDVLIYPNAFDFDFNIKGKNRRVLGMVGTGFMDNKMVLSKEALHHGFKNKTDKKNTAIHEFVHLIDKSDGTIDGVPKALLEKQYVIPWLDLMNQKIDKIYQGKTDINPYGGTNRAEFFSVTSEYFFERPKLLKKKHPKLYDLLEEVFNQKMTGYNFKKQNIELGRNSPCPCNNLDIYITHTVYFDFFRLGIALKGYL